LNVTKLLALLVVLYVLLVAGFESWLGYSQPAGQSTLVITTTTDNGDTRDRVLSLLKSDEQLYVAANHWPRAWYRQALKNPAVTVSLAGETGAYLAVPVNDGERQRLTNENRHSLFFRFLTGFPPRYFVRLDPR
jgi:hypothetical protein